MFDGGLVRAGLALQPWDMHRHLSHANEKLASTAANHPCSTLNMLIAPAIRRFIRRFRRKIGFKVQAGPLNTKQTVPLRQLTISPLAHISSSTREHVLSHNSHHQVL